METQTIERIFLIGLSGSGKTTVGARLAALLGWAFVDTDDLVERLTGQCVGDLFASAGEARFRDLESDALKQAVEATRVVVATGGGIGERERNLALMRARGWTVWLAIPPGVAWERLRAEADAAGAPPGAARPLLAGDDPLARLAALDARRQEWYRAADERIAADRDTPQTLAGRIAAGLIALGRLPKDGATSAERFIRTAGGNSYDAVVAWGGLATLGERLRALDLPPRLFVVADATVASLYETGVMSLLARAGFAPELYRVPPGEASKSREQWNALLDWLADHRAERAEAMIALGGGVVGDLAGFVAATYLRGIPVVQVPTSLLAQVDASIGGKVAIDHPRGKNLVGAFYPPRLVLADPAVLTTLTPRHRTEGWAEIIKAGVALDRAYFEWLERRADDLLGSQPAAMTEAIARAVALKAEIVEEDEREAGRRALLNYGHTLGHALETVTGYNSLLHGEAVAIGMAFAARLGRRIGVTPAEVVARQEALLTRLGLPTRIEGLTSEAIMRAMLWDKKTRDGRLRWITPTALGAATLTTDVADADVRAVLLEIGAVDHEPSATR